MKPTTTIAIAAALIAATAAASPAYAADSARSGAAVAQRAASQTFQTTTRWIGGGSSVNIRRSPSVNAALARSVGVGTSVAITCQTTGGKLGFSSYSENRTWDQLTDGTYIHDVVTTTPGGPRTNLPDGGYVAWTTSLPQCQSTTQGPSGGTAAALAWAGRQVNRSIADTVDSGLFSAKNWSPGPVGEWSGDCVKFVDVAWRYGGKGPIVSAATADALWQVYGSPQNPSGAPAGALVFWRKGGVVGSAGHVALSDGNGGVYTTQGQDNQGKPVAHVTYAQLGYGTPTGWALR